MINDKHISFALKLSEDAGKIMINNFKLGMKKEWKEDGSPVTKTDIEIDNMVVQRVHDLFPDHGILAEESGLDKVKEYLWVCDPIDGTRPFSIGMPTFAFSIALVHGGVPLLGVVCDPVLGRTFLGIKDRGAFYENNKLKVSSQKRLEKGAVVGIGSTKSMKYNIQELSNQLYEKNVSRISVGSATYTGMLVAAGEFVASIYPITKPWDTAALKVIVEEAGGRVTDFKGNNPMFNKNMDGSLVTNGFVHDEILDLVQKFAEPNPNFKESLVL